LIAYELRIAHIPENSIHRVTNLGRNPLQINPQLPRLM
jgi:oxalate decarboxylase/phosphoglucose isomerase-like protein (cupin superfamily)